MEVKTNVRTRSEVPQLVEALGHKTGGSGLDSRYGPWKYSSDLVLLSAFSSPDTQPVIGMRTKGLPWRLSAAGAYSSQLCCSSSAEWHSKDGSPTLHLYSESSLLVVGKLYFYTPRKTSWMKDWIKIVINYKCIYSSLLYSHRRENLVFIFNRVYKIRQWTLSRRDTDSAFHQ